MARRHETHRCDFGDVCGSTCIKAAAWVTLLVSRRVHIPIGAPHDTSNRVKRHRMFQGAAAVERKWTDAVPQGPGYLKDNRRLRSYRCPRFSDIEERFEVPRQQGREH
ncbi:hypothetical protein FA13DRAFT_224570 [Coprinellus micaceus]|uniref:Uncharacterized protein n=1 Tax=Coprinellus micaceus TaxID=71717 RepID=A0A4Y7TFI9_COPMI|nr:hypothetical protein FA13DRAFT_224570 [Coprinellus micaceus]